MEQKKVYVTKGGLAQLQKEYDELTTKKRPELLDILSVARSEGDLSENAEYQAAKQDLAFIDGRIDELEEVLKQAVIISDDTTGNTRVVSLGSQVKVKIGGHEYMYKLVGEWEASPAEKKISHESPLGKALIGRSIGETVEVDAPAGKVAYTIVSIE